MFKSEIKIKKSTKNDLLLYKFDQCSFCGKKKLDYMYYYDLQKKLSKNNFFCNFCLRNNFNKSHENIMILTFEPIIKKCQNHYSKYKIDKLQFKELIDSHKNAGLLHPAFLYDEESYKWFVDFNKIDDDKKLSIKSVFENILNILVCFNASQFRMNINYKKIFNYINDFKDKKSNKILIIGN